MTSRILAVLMGALLALALMWHAPARAGQDGGQCMQMPLAPQPEAFFTLFDGREDMILDHVSFFIDPDDGQLYLIHQWKRCRIVDGKWRFYKFLSVKWTEEDGSRDIKVTAQYVTGKGPQGAYPMTVETVLRREFGGGVRELHSLVIERAAEPVDLSDLPGQEPAPGKPARSGSMFNEPIPISADSAAALADLNRRLHTGEHLRPEDIDFCKQRIAGAYFTLTSGSMMLKDIEVYRDADGYRLLYTLTRPHIGTADIKRSFFYAVLPKDGLPFRVIDRREGGAQGQAVDAPVRIINRIAIRSLDGEGQ